MIADINRARPSRWGAGFLVRSIVLSDHVDAVHVRDQHVGNLHTAVALLIAFEDRRDRPADRHAAAVERVNKLGLRFRLTTELYPRSTRLKV